ATDSTSEALAATPKAVKAAYDLAKGKYTAQDATTAQKGIVQLSSETDSTSEALAATPKAVKAANDNAAAANKNASERVSKSGDSMTGTLNQDSVAQATYNLTALSNAVTGNKNYLRKMRGGGTDTIWHETVQGGEYRLATGSTDAQEELAISTSAGVRTRGNFTSQTGGFYSGNAKKFSFVSSNTSDKNATLRLWGNADRPTVVELGDDTGYHLYSQRSKDGSLQFQYNGAGLFSGYLRAGGEVQSSSANSYRIAYGAFGTFWRNDGGSLYLMLTNKDDPWGNYNALRPFRVSLNNGEVIISKLNLSDFGYFDARYYTKAQSDAGYMPKTGAYTKAESDGRFQPKGNYTPAGQAYTKAESDARYGVVNGIRRGGQQIRNPTDAWFGNWESPAGCVVTGIQMDGRSDGRKLGVYFRQMQYLNKQTGAWVNIGD
uniref:tail fiber protein n=2 Tax=Enterobacteriaceae TaxID=543 RepID=UPI000AC6EA94